MRNSKHTMPDVSIVMPAFNAQATIADAIRSVIAQSHASWELIVADDASRDATFDIARRMAEGEPRMRVLRLPTNSGGPAAPRNAAIAEARGRHIAFVDADDRWLPQKLARQLAAMAASGAQLSCSAYDVVNEHGHKIGHFQPPALATYDDLLKCNTIGCLTAIYDSHALGRRFFPECGHEDYALWLEITRQGVAIQGLNNTLATYRQVAGSVSSNKLNVGRYFWNIYRNREGFSVPRSATMCLRYFLLNRNKYADQASSKRL